MDVYKATIQRLFWYFGYFASELLIKCLAVLCLRTKDITQEVQRNLFRIFFDKKMAEEKMEDKVKSSSEQGRIYEKLMFTLFAKKGYDLLKNGSIKKFSIGTEIKMELDEKFDDIAFCYEDLENTKNLIAVQIKHKLDENFKIKDDMLFGEYYKSRNSCNKDYNLQKYFISFLRMREGLKDTSTPELTKYCKIKCVAIYATADFCNEKLHFEKCSNDDVINSFFTINSSLKPAKIPQCYQLKANDELNEIFKKSSDLHRIAREIAHCAIWESHNKRTILGKSDDITKIYLAALKEEVFVKSEKNTGEITGKNGKIKYSTVKLSEYFLHDWKEELREEIFKAMRYNDKSKTDLTDNQLQEILQDIEFKITLNGDSESKMRELPEKWQTVEIAKEIAHCAISESHGKKTILGETDNIKVYLAALKKVVFGDFSNEKTEKITGKNGKIEFKNYSTVKLSKKFFDDSGSKIELREEIFKVMKHYDKSNNDKTDCELKEKLKSIEFKITLNDDSECKKKELPKKWQTVKDSDIDDFLNCFRLFTNQPNLECLKKYIYSERHFFFKGTELGEMLEKAYPKFKDSTERSLQMYNKSSFCGRWLSAEEIEDCVQEQYAPIFIILLSSFYEAEIMQYGSFDISTDLQSSDSTSLILDSFLKYEKSPKIKKEEHILLENAKMLSFSSEVTQLTTVKLLQYLKIKNHGKIYLEWDVFKKVSKQVKDAFKLENNNLLIIECRHTVNEQCEGEIFRSFSSILEANHDKKKQMIIIKKNDLNNVSKDVHDQENLYIKRTDDINLKDFKPKRNPLNEKVIVFQQEKEKLCLAKLIGFEKWYDFVEYLSKNGNVKKSVIADIMMEILDNKDIKVGRQPLGTSSLRGAYDTLIEEINPGALSNKLVDLIVRNVNSDGDYDDNSDYDYDGSVLGGIFPQERESSNVTQNLDDNANKLYIFDGISGSDKKEKVENLIECLKLPNEQEENEALKKLILCPIGLITEQDKKQNLEEILKDNYNILFTTGKFEDDNFKQICSNYPEKMVFWIHYDGQKFILQQLYNPNFYFNRKFKNVVMNKRLKEELIKENPYETFIFHSVEDEEFMKYLDYREAADKETFVRNCQNGKIRIFSSDDDANSTFQSLCERRSEGQTVHLLKFESQKLVWCESHGSLGNLKICIDNEKSEKSVIEQDKLIKEIRNKKVVIIADDPGMGKTCTLTKLYESKSFIETHWIIRINLRDHIQAIQNMDLEIGNYIFNIIEFLTKINPELNNYLAKCLLTLALDKNKNITRPLLFVVDGLDEVLDEKDRNKIISVLKFLNDKTPAKLWITTRLHLKEILENKLSAFSIQFIPLDDETRGKYIQNYLKNRLCFILNKEDFQEICINNDDRKMAQYTDAFLKKIKSVFTNNRNQLIGTPLHLSLMLERSIGHFKNWIINTEEIPDFSYLGSDILEVYENVIKRKYDIYFKKMNITELMQQGLQRIYFDDFHTDLAKSKVLGLKLRDDFTKLKDLVLLVGIVSDGDNPDFYHKTFEEFFAAKEFIHWIEKKPNEFSNSKEQEYLLKDVLMKPNYQFIRILINAKLEKIKKTEFSEETQLSKENLIQFGKVAGELLEKETIIDKNGSPLHVAIIENNKGILHFLINSLEEQSEVLKKFLIISNSLFYNALHLACDPIYGAGDLETVNILLNAAARISEDALQTYLHFSSPVIGSALDVAAVRSQNFEISKELLNRAKNKLELVLNENKLGSSFILALVFENDVSVHGLLNEFKNDEDALKKMFLGLGEGETAFHRAVNNYEFFKLMLVFLNEIEDKEELFKKIVLPKKATSLLNAAVTTMNYVGGILYFRHKEKIVKLILDTTEKVNDGYHTLKRLILFKDTEGKTALDHAVLDPMDNSGSYSVLILILEKAIAFDKDTLKKVIYSCNAITLKILFISHVKGRIQVSLEVLTIIKEAFNERINNDIRQYGTLHFNDIRQTVVNCNKNIFMRSVVWNLPLKLSIILRKSWYYDMNSSEIRTLFSAVDCEERRRNALHIACECGNLDIIRILLSSALYLDDEGKTLEALVTSSSSDGKIPFEVLEDKSNNMLQYLFEAFETKLRIDERREETSQEFEGVRTVLQNIKQKCRERKVFEQED